MNEPRPISPRQRLQALLSVPDRERTDAQWDELNELEIMLASGNREGNRDETPKQDVRRNPTAPAGQPKPGGGRHGKKPMKKFHRRPPRGNTP
jgi:hypothetical protein